MKVIDVLFRISKFFWVPFVWVAVISVFLFCVGRPKYFMEEFTDPASDLLRGSIRLFWRALRRSR